MSREQIEQLVDAINNIAAGLETLASLSLDAHDEVLPAKELTIEAAESFQYEC